MIFELVNRNNKRDFSEKVFFVQNTNEIEPKIEYSIQIKTYFVCVYGQLT